MSWLGSPLDFGFGGGGIPIALPNVYARMMLSLLPPGKLWRTLESSVLFEVLAGCAEELSRVDARAGDLFNESDPLTTLELLPEYERELALESDGSDEERRGRVVARLLARQRLRPVDFQEALAPLLGQVAEDVVVLERTHAMAASMGDDREIYRFFIYRDPTLPGSYFLDSAQSLVDKIAASHTIGHVIESVDFLCDDEFSLCDRDLLGA